MAREAISASRTRLMISWRKSGDSDPMVTYGKPWVSLIARESWKSLRSLKWPNVIPGCTEPLLRRVQIEPIEENTVSSYDVESYWSRVAREIVQRGKENV